jgi:hypothetical protein
MKRVVFIGLLVLTALMLGFYQERLKISINYVIENGPQISGFFEMNEQQRKEAIELHRVNAPFDYYHNHSTEEWLYRLSFTQLNRLKWAVTIVSLAVFCFLNALILRMYSGHWKLARRLIMMYAVMVVAAFAIFFVGRFSGHGESAYAISRRITGALQSLVPLMIIFPALWLMNLKTPSHENNG